MLRWVVLMAACTGGSPSPGPDASRDAARDTGTDSGRDAGDAERPDAGAPLPPRVPNEGCRPPGTAVLATYFWETAFPLLGEWDHPVWVGTAPDDGDTMFVVEQGGRIHAFDDRPDVTERSLFLEVPVRQVGSEEGLLSLAFHPEHARNGRFFVSYTSETGCPPDARSCVVVSEFRRAAPRTADPASERRVLVVGKRYGNHNGCDLHFGNDGFLYASLGDGGGAGASPGDPRERLGTILRLDVDAPGSGYVIPPNNPFADGREGAPEVYVWGLRNPWRISIDRVTNALWIGDVGAVTNEEIDKVTGPAHLGWNIREGNVCFRAAECATEGLTPPVYAYDRTVGAVVIGGLVYRGSELPELFGSYLFADYARGWVFALRERGAMPPEVTGLFRVGAPTSFGEDAHGRVYLATFGRGVVRLARGDGPTPPPIPARLSETGCFDDVASHRVAPGIVGYDVNVPQWSDGATHERHLALPSLEQALPAAEGAWSFPVGTVFLDTVSVRAPGGATRRVETRMLALGETGWRGYAWRWLDDQSDAVLVEGSARATIDTDGGSLEWTFPSRAECLQCHSDAHGSVLGFRTRQLARAHGGPTLGRIAALVEAGYVADGLDGPVAAHVEIDDEAAPLAARARAYLDVQCAQCHRPSGSITTEFDLRAEVSMAETGLCDARALYGEHGIEAATVLAPGDPGRSLVHARLRLPGAGRMPPVGSLRVDEAAVRVVGDWIRSGAGCP
jgi:glucose/arabinose dehydrogenase